MTYTHTRRACYTAFVVQAIVVNLAPLLFIVFLTRYGISYEMLGRLVLLNFVTQLTTDIVAIRIVDRVGFRIPAVTAHVMSLAGLVLMAVLPSALASPYLGLSVATMVYAVGGGLLEVLVSPIVDALPTPQQGKPAAMSLLHSFYCWGQVAVVLLTTLLLALVGNDNWQILPLAWALVPLANLVVFLRVPLPRTVPDEHRTALRKLFSAPAFLAVLVTLMCAGASELTMSQWSSLFAEQGLGVPKVLGDLAGPALFAAFMGVGRFAFGLWGEKLRLAPMMIACGAMAALCYLTAALARNPALSLAGCALCGLTVSLLWPGSLSLASARFPLGGAAMFGVLAVFGDLGAASGPWLAGAVADAASGSGGLFSALAALLPGGAELRAGLLIATIFPLGVVAGTMAYDLAARRPARDAQAASAP